MMQRWYAMWDAMRDAYARYDREKQEPGLNFEIQVCHWKYEKKSLENYIKDAGIGGTVWKWQAIQIWPRSAIYSKYPSKCNKMNMLQHPNMV